MLSAGWSKARFFDARRATAAGKDALTQAGWDGSSLVRIGEGGPGVTTCRKRYIEEFDRDFAIRDTTAERAWKDLAGFFNAPLLGVRWLVDGFELEDPIDARGRKLELEADVVGIPDESHGLSFAMQREPFVYVECEYELIAAGRSVARPEDANMIVLDIGGESSGAVLYESGRLTRVQGLHRGVAQLARDVSFDANIPFGDGLDLLEGNKREREAVGIVASASGAAAEVLTDFAEYLRQELAVHDMWARADEVVLTGGGAKLPGMRDAIAGSLELHTSIGRPVGIEGFRDVGPEWSVAYGLALLAGDGLERRDVENPSKHVVVSSPLRV